MNSLNFGSLTTPQGLGMRSTRSMMPRMIPRNKGLGVPSLGGLGVLRLAAGGYAEGGHPSMGWLAVRDAMRSMPRHVVPDYMLARMAGGGSPEDYGIAGPANPLDYPRRALSRQVDDLDMLRYELAQRPVRGNVDRWTPSVAQHSPQAQFTQMGRINQSMDELMAQRARENPEEGYSFDPSDIPMSLSFARGLPGLVSPGPVGGGLAALLRSSEAHAPSMHDERLAQTFDPRVIAAARRYSPFGRRARQLLGARD